MTIKTILVPLDGSEESARVLDTAMFVAQRYDGHIDALHVLPRVGERLPYTFAGLSAKLAKTVMAETSRAARDKADAVRAQFDAFCARHEITLSEHPTQAKGVTAAWREDAGEITEVLVRHGRLTDAITIARPARHAGTVRRTPVGENFQALLLRAGRPVLVVPPTWEARRVQQAAIGWNESLEATRAVAMTLPWLSQMQSVTVLASGSREKSARALVEYLGWHDCKAALEVLEPGDAPAGERMLAQCTALGTELLVVGGFSHARSRQLLFGGVTRHLLTHSEIVTVMVH